MNNSIKKDNLKMAIVGHGFVGKAADYGFEENVDKYIVDPKYDTQVKDLSRFKPDIVFVCVPTPMSHDGSQDSSIISNVVNEINEHCPQAIKVIKSTVTPSVIEDISKQDKQLIYNPEFLREKHANIDFINSEMIILGGNKETARKVSEIYSQHSKCVKNNFIFTDLKTASLIKYSINTFLALKVIYFNELNEIFENLEVSDTWSEIISAISNDNRIGTSHMDVPGHDAKKGFGGACFPKDTLAFLKYAKQNGLELSVLESAIKKNNKIRSEYEKIDDREAEQNVSFDDKL